MDGSPCLKHLRSYKRDFLKVLGEQHVQKKEHRALLQARRTSIESLCIFSPKRAAQFFKRVVHFEAHFGGLPGVIIGLEMAIWKYVEF